MLFEVIDAWQCLAESACAKAAPLCDIDEAGRSECVEVGANDVSQALVFGRRIDLEARLRGNMDRSATEGPGLTPWYGQEPAVATDSPP